MIEKDSWSKEEKLKNIPDQEFQKMFGENWRNIIVVGLYTGDFLIFKVKRGASTKDFNFETE